MGTVRPRKRPFIELLARMSEEELDQALFNKGSVKISSFSQRNREGILKALRNIHGSQARSLAEEDEESNLPDVEEFCRLMLESGVMKIGGYGADDGLVGSVDYTLLLG